MKQFFEKMKEKVYGFLPLFILIGIPTCICIAIFAVRNWDNIPNIYAKLKTFGYGSVLFGIFLFIASILAAFHLFTGAILALGKIENWFPNYFSFCAYILILTLGAMCLTKIDNIATQEEHRPHGATYAEGYREGLDDSPGKIDFMVEEDLSNLTSEIKETWGVDPESAISIIANFADGEPVSESELNKAIWAMHQYYFGSYEIVNGIEDYSLD